MDQRKLIRCWILSRISIYTSYYIFAELCFAFHKTEENYYYYYLEKTADLQ